MPQDDAGATARDLAALRETLTDLAKKATPGPWEAASAEVWAAGEPVANTLYWPANDPNGDAHRRNAAFIAAANPSAVLTLCAELDRLARENALLLGERTTARAAIARFAAMEARVREVRASIDASVRAYEGKSTLASIRGELVAVLAFVDTALCDDPDVADISIDDERLRELMAESTLAEQAEALGRVCDDNDAPFAASALRKMAAALATQPPTNTERAENATCSDAESRELIEDWDRRAAANSNQGDDGDIVLRAAGDALVGEIERLRAENARLAAQVEAVRAISPEAHLVYDAELDRDVHHQYVSKTVLDSVLGVALATEPAASDG